MPRLLLIESSPTLRHGLHEQLHAKGFEVRSAAACEEALSELESSGAPEFSAVLLGWSDACAPSRDALVARLQQPRFRHVGLLVLLCGPARKEPDLPATRPLTMVSRLHDPCDAATLVPPLVHGLLAQAARETRLRDEHARLQQILSSMGDGVYAVDRAGCITFANPAAVRLLRFDRAEELVGRSAHERVHPADERGRRIPTETCFLQQAYELGDSLSDWETIFWRADGHPMCVECSVRPLQHDGECTGAVVTFRDIGERKRFDAEMQWQLHHDPLTKLSNRRHFEDTLQREVARLHRSAEQSALLFIDLDRFKQINDTAGHAAGDALLGSIGQRLRARSRQSDLVARLGGDEFAVLLRNVDDRKVRTLAEKFRSILDESSFAHGGREFDVSGSVGICTLDRRTVSPAHAMNCADAACRIAKRHGRNRVHRFDMDEDDDALAAMQQSWSTRLREALAHDRFALQFQPIFDLRHLPAGACLEQRAPANHCAASGSLHAHEVFLRLDDGASRQLPGAFLSQAERFNLLPAIDSWVVDRLAGWASPGGAASSARLHVNAAIASLLDADYRARLAALMREGPFAPGQLCLEIKQGDAAAQGPSIVPVLCELVDLGIGLVLDDYGRGFGALDHLRQIPLVSVKLDATLLPALQQDDFGVAMVRAMADLAHARHLTVIAPMVDDIATLAPLRAAGVDCVQGDALASTADQFWTADARTPAEPPPLSPA